MFEFQVSTFNLLFHSQVLSILDFFSKAVFFFQKWSQKPNISNATDFQTKRLAFHCLTIFNWSHLFALENSKCTKNPKSWNLRFLWNKNPMFSRKKTKKKQRSGSQRPARDRIPHTSWFKRNYVRYAHECAELTLISKQAITLKKNVANVIICSVTAA